MNKDITYCTGDGCNKKKTCKRYIEINPESLYFFKTVPFKKKLGGQSCEHYKRVK